MSKINPIKTHEANGTISDATTNPELRVNEEHASLLPPPSDSEYESLEISIRVDSLIP